MTADAPDDMTEELLEMLKVFLLGANVLLFIAAACVYVTSPKAAPSAALAAAASDAPSNATKRALLVTAHPDDESMFFLPLVHSLAQRNASKSAPEWELHLLCLSRGNFDGLGAEREQEMRACSAFLGLAPQNVCVLEDPKLQDGMAAVWDHAHIANIVLAYIEAHAINAVFTFDDYGVSGHPNHIATHFGVRQAVAEQHARCIRTSSDTDQHETTAAVAPVRAWMLESTSLARKYIGVLDAIVSSWTLGRDGAFVFLARPQWNYAAMALHRSQFVWYRRLFVLFSRYTFVNTFEPMVRLSERSDDDKKTQ